MSAPLFCSAALCQKHPKFLLFRNALYFVAPFLFSDYGAFHIPHLVPLTEFISCSGKPLNRHLTLQKMMWLLFLCVLTPLRRSATV